MSKRSARRARHENAESPTLKRGNPSSSSGRLGEQQFRNIAGKGLVHMVKTDIGWNEMSSSQASTTGGDKKQVIIRGGSGGGGTGGGGVGSTIGKSVNNAYTGADDTVKDIVFADTFEDAYIRGIRSQNNNLTITVVDSLDYGSYINLNAISGTGLESVQSYNEVNNSYDTAIGANTNLKFASDYDDGASTGIFFTATDSGNDTILTPTINFPPDTNTTYTTSWVDSSANAILRLTPSSGSDDDLTLVACSNIYLTPVGDNLTIAANNTTNYSLVNSTGNPTGSHTIVMTSSGTEGRLRALKPGNNITMTTTTSDSDTSYVTLNADLSGATISNSYVNPSSGYFTYTASNMRFLDGTGITWALSNEGNGLIEITPTVTITDTNTQNIFTSTWVDDSDDVLFRLTKSGTGSGTQDIKLVAGSNIYLTPSSSSSMTIAANNTTSYALTNSGSTGQQATLVTVNTGTAGKLRGFKQGSNITITSTDDGEEGNGYITIAANLSAATISTSYTNPLGGYLTQTTGNLRFVDNGKISWALAAQGSNVTTVTPTIASYSASDVGAISTSHAANSISSSHITILGNTTGTNSGNVCSSNHTGAGYLTSSHTSSASAHHTKYTNSNATSAMGSKGDSNPYHHDKYTNSNATSAMGSKGNSNAFHHDRYANSEAVAAVNATSSITTTCNSPDVNHNTDVNWNCSTISGLASTGRSTLGLGTAAQSATGDFAAASHNHSTGNITSGTLGLARGGTGVTSIASLKTALALGSAAYTDSGAYATSSHGHSYVTSAVAGTGISVSGGTGAVTITNTAPDVNHNTDVNWDCQTISNSASTCRNTIGLDIRNCC